MSFLILATYMRECVTAVAALFRGVRTIIWLIGFVQFSWD